MTETYTTRNEVEAAIVAAIEAGDVDDARAEFDIEAIADSTYFYNADTQRFEQAHTDDVATEYFWAAVEKNAK